jgi:peptidoglycan/xylan/chitin deacetylase (PgdA/CDA1 family)
MEWDDVRGLREMGLEIGAHTKSHVNLGEVNGGVAREEIEGSGVKLRDELSSPVDLFSFPYGLRRHITDGNRALVRETGYRCCCSAYGGDVRPDADPMDLRRVPVSRWFVSPYQLGFELLHETGPE